MSELKRPRGEEKPPAGPPEPGYEPPAIAWEEDFEPAAQATSCAHLPLDCNIRPQS